jgi:RNA polymerase sigma-70 factor (ECF subfamily)
MGTSVTSSTHRQDDFLAAARDGDEDAFRILVEPHRVELHAHCYRMLGSVHDAEDALQDVLLRAWRGLRNLESRGALRAWLYKIATNTCLDARQPKRVLPVDYGLPANRNDPGEAVAEAVWVEPYPDEQFGLGPEESYAAPEARYEQREAVELAFIAALQHLPPRQRAVLILREVLGFSAREVAESLETTEASVNSALQRARHAVDRRLPEQSQQVTMRSLGDERVRDLVDRFIDAFESGDIDAIIAMLTEDATFAMPPYPNWYRGRDAIGGSWLMPGGPPPRLRYIPTRANGQLALATYQRELEAERYVPIALDVLTLRGPRIADITAFRNPDIFRRFGLPEELAA